jgi:hypothetical protein
MSSDDFGWPHKSGAAPLTPEQQLENAEWFERKSVRWLRSQGCHALADQLEKPASPQTLLEQICEAEATMRALGIPPDDEKKS